VTAVLVQDERVGMLEGHGPRALDVAYTINIEKPPDDDVADLLGQLR
jgi:hypothetical protein